MRIGVLSRFPLAEATLWKQQLIEGLLADGHTVFVVFGKSSPRDHAREAIRRAVSHKGSRDIRHLVPNPFQRHGSSESTAISATANRATANRANANPATANPANANPANAKRLKRLTVFAKERAIAVRGFSSVNSPEAITFITDQKPDLLILAGAEIVRPPLLAIPPCGTLNPHYGPLPEFRGMSAQEWCLYMQVPPAVTIHFVSSGIDTGDIVSVTPLPLRATDSWSDVRRHCQNVARDTLLTTVRNIASDQLQRTQQLSTAGKQYFAMHPRLLIRAKSRLESGYWQTPDRHDNTATAGVSSDITEARSA